MSIHEEVLQLIQKEGPILPIEAASKLNTNSFLINACLTEMVEKGQLKTHSEKIGSNYLYLLIGQEAKAKQRALELLDNSQKTARQYQTNQVASTPELQQKRDQFAQKLKEIEDREKKQKEISKPVPKKEKDEFLERMKPKLEVKDEKTPFESIKATVKSTLDKLTSPKKEFVDIALTYLKEKDVEILEKTRDKRSGVTLIVNITSQLGTIKYLVKIKDKRRLNEADLSLMYTEALERKLPLYILTPGKLTKTAQSYLKTTGSFLKVKELQ
jgi:hypothetical protein